MPAGDLLFRLLLEMCTDGRRGHRGTDMTGELRAPPPSGPAFGSGPLGAGLRDSALRTPSPMGAPEPGSGLVSPGSTPHEGLSFEQWEGGCWQCLQWAGF